MSFFLKECSFSRPSSLPEKKDITQGVDFCDLKRIESKGKEKTLEIKIVKNIEEVFSITLVYEISCEKGSKCNKKKCEYCNEVKTIKAIISYEANLLTSLVLKDMNFPPFPVLLGNLEHDKIQRKK